MPEFDLPQFKADRTLMADRARPSLLLFGDSFAYGMPPYLRESFGEIAFMHRVKARAALKLCSERRYDAVALELVERALARPSQAEASDAPVADRGHLKASRPAR